MSTLPETTGAIYDIGYRHYEGPRLGRRGAIAAIVGAGLRAVFGLGRSGRAKILPWGAIVLAVMPAIVAVAIRVLVGDLVDLYSYENYLWSIGALLPIFVASQAPELVVNDMRHRVLPLYFSRPIGRVDYIVAKLAALTLALLGLTLLPVLVLFTGRVLAAEDLVAALGDEIGALPGIVGSGVLHAVVLAALGLAICSLAGRRAYAAGAVLAVFLVGGVVSDLFATQAPGLQAIAPFTSPTSILDGAREWLFGGTVAESPVGGAGLPLVTYGVAAAVLLGVSLAILALRYRRVTT
ncbi:MAG: ABC transporter permease [Candidatus Limnocylindria bacterium]